MRFLPHTKTTQSKWVSLPLYNKSALISRYIESLHETFTTEHLFDFLGRGVAIPLTCSARRRVAALAAFARRRYNGFYTSQAVAICGARGYRLIYLYHMRQVVARDSSVHITSTYRRMASDAYIPLSSYLSAIG